MVRTNIWSLSAFAVPAVRHDLKNFCCFLGSWMASHQDRYAPFRRGYFCFSGYYSNARGFQLFPAGQETLGYNTFERHSPSNISIVRIRAGERHQRASRKISFWQKLIILVLNLVKYVSVSGVNAKPSTRIMRSLPKQAMQGEARANHGNSQRTM